jgi:uncharacterized membrane protein
MRLAAAALAAALLTAASAGAAERTLVIDSFDATVQVAVDGSIDVVETITPTFTGSWNGIYRTIPVEYRTPQGLNYTLRLRIEDITDGAGNSLRYESSRVRHYRKLKIWVPGAQDATRTVRIHYAVTNALRFFDEHDELYWNITGDEWDVPIRAATASIQLPASVTGVRATAFRGDYGSTTQNQVTVDGSSIRVATEGLGFHEGLTVVAGWDPGVVHRPTTADRVGDTLLANAPLALPPLIFAGMFALWRSRGRDPGLATISTQYEPPAGMTPAELGTLADGKPDMRDITATIVDLAVHGYLRIEEAENDRFLGLWSSKDYTFSLTRPRDAWSALKPHERELLGAMFGADEFVSLSDLKNTFYKRLPGLKDQLYDGLVKGGFYTSRPDRVRTLFIVGGVILGVVIAVGGVSVMTSLGMQPVSAVIAGFASAAIVAAFGWFMPSRTVRGTRELESILGFREFLARVDKDRMERVIKTPEMFEKFLPYAMALGVESNWAKAFEGIYSQPPQWYSGSSGAYAFNPGLFTNNLTRMSATAATVMASAPRGSGGSGFGGGGFSGGGFGGGGGGGF